MKIAVLLSGKQGSGKSTLAQAIYSQLGLIQTKFAEPLYAMHEAVRHVASSYGIPFDRKEGRLLQLLGTEWGRQTKGEGVWVDAAVRKALDWMKLPNVGGVVFDDCRFNNEFHAFDQVSGVRVVRIRLEASSGVRKARADGWRDADTHASETELDRADLPWDLVINTDILTVGGTKRAAFETINAALAESGAALEAGTSEVAGPGG